MIFYNPVSAGIKDWVFQLGLQAAGWSTAFIANTWIKEVLFDDLKQINTPTGIFQGVNDRVVLYPLAVSLKQGIKNAKLISFEQCGHFLFYDKLEAFNTEFVKFLRE